MHTPRSTQTQFSLRSLLVLTTIFAALFGILAAAGISAEHALAGFGVLGIAIGLAAVAVEGVYQVCRLR
jgi:small-conductance mechanosensitive channel